MNVPEGVDLIVFRIPLAIVLVVVTLMATGIAWSQVPGGSGGAGGNRGSAGKGGPDTSHVPPPRATFDQDANRATVVSAVQYRLDLLGRICACGPNRTRHGSSIVTGSSNWRATCSAWRARPWAGICRHRSALDGLGDIARDRLTAIEDIVDAGKALYAMLTPAQQSVADRRMAVPVMALVGVEPVQKP